MTMFYKRPKDIPFTKAIKLVLMRRALLLLRTTEVDLFCGSFLMVGNVINTGNSDSNLNVKIPK